MTTKSVPLTLEEIYASDVGLFLCCLLYIACRVKVFISTTAIESTNTISSPRREIDGISNGVRSPIYPNTVSTTNTNNNNNNNGNNNNNNNNNNNSNGGGGGGVVMSTGIDKLHMTDTLRRPSSCNNVDMGIPVNSTHPTTLDGIAVSSFPPFHGNNNNNNNGLDGEDSNQNYYDEEVESDILYENDPLLRLLALPLTLRIMVAVNWLSVISNCLTYFLRPSQVLYAFLVCSCDMMLHVVGDHISGKRNYYYNNNYNNNNNNNYSNNNNNNNNNKQRLLRSASGITTVSLESEGVSRMIDDVVSTHAVMRTTTDTIRGQKYNNEESNINIMNTETIRSYNEGREVFLRESRIRENDWKSVDGINSQPNTAAPPAITTPVCNDDVGTERTSVIFWRHARAATQRGAFLVMLNLMLVFALVIFHVNHLMFGTGTFTGYLASCGTLYVLGCDLGLLSLLVEWYVSRRASHASSTLLQSENLEISGLDTSSLPPYAVLLNRRLGIYYIMQHVFSFACSALYFSMLLEEGEPLYSTHVEFMRWYMNTVGQGLLDIVRLLVFWYLMLLSRGREGKRWHHQLYGVGKVHECE